jgi:hypothetical protein
MDCGGSCRPFDYSLAVTIRPMSEIAFHVNHRWRSLLRGRLRELAAAEKRQRGLKRLLLPRLAGQHRKRVQLPTAMVVCYRRLDFLAVTLFRATFALFCFGLGFGAELARIVSAFEDSTSDSSYASRSQSVMGASTSSRCLI